MDAFTVFLEKLSKYGLDYFKVYPGVYRARVKRTDDPEQRGRIQILCTQVGHDPSKHPDVWVDASFSGAGPGHGFFHPPSVDDCVFVSFDCGNASRPNVYWGGWYGKEMVPPPFGYGPDGTPQVRGIKTPGGHVLAFSDKPGDEFILLSWKEGGATIKIDKDKSINVQNGAASLALNADGSLVLKDVANSKITLDGKGSIIFEATRILFGGLAALNPFVKFNEFIQWAASHIHVGGTGPTSVAVPPPGPNIASTKVSTSG